MAFITLGQIKHVAIVTFMSPDATLELRSKHRLRPENGELFSQGDNGCCRSANSQDDEWCLWRCTRKIAKVEKICLGKDFWL